MRGRVLGDIKAYMDYFRMEQFATAVVKFGIR